MTENSGHAAPAPRGDLLGSVDSLASAFQDGFTNGNAIWDETPEHHKEMFREGVRSLLRGQGEETIVEGEDTATLHSEGTPEGGVIRLSKCLEGYVLWYHGQIAWRSWAKKLVQLRVTGFRGNPLRVVLSSGDEATISQRLIDSFASPSPFEQHPDDVAVDRFAASMKAKLAKKREDGAGGWDDPEVCHIDYLAHLLREQIHSRAALDPVDIGNFAMMIFNRGETPGHGR